MKKALVISILTLILGLVTPALAAEAPNFSTCLNPTGELKVKYEQGEHAIVGDTILRSGSDEVYWVGQESALQCFCPSNGEGVQTLWWKVDPFDLDEIDAQVQSGWHFIPNGSSWGLTDNPYLAKNSEYSCKGGSSNVGGDGDTGGGEILPTSALTTRVEAGSVLGLARTGGSVSMYALVSLGVAMVSGGVLIRRRA